LESCLISAAQSARLYSRLVDPGEIVRRRKLLNITCREDGVANLTARFWERHVGSLTPLASNARAHKSGIVGQRWKRLATNWFQQQKGEARCRDYGHSIESVRVKGGPTGESNRCDPNATRHGKRPLSARCLQRKQTTLKSANIMCVCETPGSRSRTDASLLNFPMWRKNNLLARPALFRA